MLVIIGWPVDESFVFNGKEVGKDVGSTMVPLLIPHLLALKSSPKCHHTFNVRRGQGQR